MLWSPLPCRPSGCCMTSLLHSLPRHFISLTTVMVSCVTVLISLSDQQWISHALFSLSKPSSLCSHMHLLHSSVCSHPLLLSSARLYQGLGKSSYGSAGCLWALEICMIVGKVCASSHLTSPNLVSNSCNGSADVMLLGCVALTCSNSSLESIKWSCFNIFFWI